MAHWRILASLVVALTLTGAVQAQTHSLSEASLPDSYHRIQLSMALTGTLELQQEGKKLSLTESVSATHDYVERVLEAGPEGTATKSVGAYKDAKVSIAVDADKMEHTLQPEHTLLIAQRERGQDSALVYCPKGMLTREELDVADHFDTLSITGLLPAKEVGLGETWKLGNAVVQALCHLQGLSDQTLTATLEKVQEDVAIFSINGTVSGIDVGAAVSCTIKATCQFDTKNRCLTGVEWTQKEERGSGPVSPASTIEMKIKLTRTPVEAVNDLDDVLMPAQGFQPKRDLTDLVFKDAKDRFELCHSREWQLVGHTDEHTVLRLMDRGEFVAQVSIAPWKKSAPGKHLSPDEVKSIVANSPGWSQDTLFREGEVKLPSGQWAYLVAGGGDLDDVAAVQYFYVVAGPGGEQAIVTFTMTPGQTQKLGSRDLEFVEGFLLPGAGGEDAQVKGGGTNRQPTVKCGLV